MTECGECYALPSATNYLSPGLAHGGQDGKRAIELKFLLPLELANRLRERARSELQIDPFANRETGQYKVCSLYLDTIAFDIYHRTPVTNGAKFRFRRYDNGLELFLERKRREQGVVTKHRDLVSLDALIHSSTLSSPIWDEAQSFGMVPSCAVEYQRDAFVNEQSGAPFRVTVDNHLGVHRFVGSDWGDLSAFLKRNRTHEDLRSSDSFRVLVPGFSVVEFKFTDSLPVHLKRWVEDFQIAPVKFSKYRTALTDPHESVQTRDGAVA